MHINVNRALRQDALEREVDEISMREVVREASYKLSFYSLPERATGILNRMSSTSSFIVHEINGLFEKERQWSSPEIPVAHLSLGRSCP
jgi:hypothetical protein